MYNTLLDRAQKHLIDAEDVDCEFAKGNINYSEVLWLKLEVSRANIMRDCSFLLLDLMKSRADIATTHEKLLELTIKADEMRAEGSLEELHWWNWEGYISAKRTALWKQTPSGKMISGILSGDPNQILNSVPQEAITTIRKN